MRTRNHYLTRITGCLVVLGLPLVAGAQQVDPADSETPAQAWFDYYQQRAANDYELVWAEDEKPLSLKKREILNWTNPLEDGKINGSTFVWEHSGRPIVVGQFFSYLIGNGKRSFCHVFSTLSDEQVLARRSGKLFWNPKLSGESGWHVVPDAPTPSASRSLRLIQMGRIAEQFGAYTEETSRGRRNLRFLPRPLYRYDESKQDADGGIFAYVVGNDPELLILVECGLTQNDSAWQYRFAQSTRSTTVATRKGEQVYRYEDVGESASSASAVYLSRHGVETIPSKLDTDR